MCVGIDQLLHKYQALAFVGAKVGQLAEDLGIGFMISDGHWRMRKGSLFSIATVPYFVEKTETCVARRFGRRIFHSGAML